MRTRRETQILITHGLPAATNGDVVTTNLVVSPANIALAAGYPQFTVTSPAHTTVQATTDANGNGTFEVSTNSASADGIYTFNAVVQTADGAVANASGHFLCGLTCPPESCRRRRRHVSGHPGLRWAEQSASVSVQFATDSTPITKSVTVNGNAATLVQTNGDSVCLRLHAQRYRGGLSNDARGCNHPGRGRHPGCPGK